MATELYNRNSSQEVFTRAFAAQWRNAKKIWDPSVWLRRDPDAKEKMLRDADIRQTIDYRCSLVAGDKWTIVAEDESSPGAATAVQVATKVLSKMRGFKDLRRCLAEAFFSGQTFARTHWRSELLTWIDGRPRNWMVPCGWEEMDRRMYRRVPRVDPETQHTHVHWERFHVHVQPAVWVPETEEDQIQTIRHTYQDRQASLGHGSALLEALGWCWYTKTHVMSEAVQAVEKHAQGPIHIQTDLKIDADTGLPNEDHFRTLLEIYEEMRARHIIVTDDKTTVTTLQGSSDGWQLLDRMEDKIRASIATLVLGSNLPTQATEGGSYALGGVQENTTQALIRSDRESLGETITHALLTAIWSYNYPNLVELGVADDMPRLTIQEDHVEDPEQIANVAEVLVRNGVRISADEVRERCGFSEPGPDDELMEAPAEPAAPGFGMPGQDPMQPQADPFGAGVM